MENNPLPSPLVPSVSLDGASTMQTDLPMGTPPPGDPPDLKASWRDMVIGGVCQQRTIIDEKFLEDKIIVSFPEGLKGDPTVSIDPILMEALESVWINSLVVKLLGNPIPLYIMERKLRELWKKFGRFQVIDLPRGFFLVIFEKKEACLGALSGGPWSVFGRCITMELWTVDFKTTDTIKTAPVWIRISDIPMELYQENVLLKLVAGIGKPIKVDTKTTYTNRANFVRVCIKVDLEVSLKGTMSINGNRFLVEYEGLPSICFECGMGGHPKSHCLHSKEKLSVSPSDSNSNQANSGGGS